MDGILKYVCKMKKIITIFLSMIFLFSNCEDAEFLATNSLQGTWHVTTVIGGLSPNKNYDKGTFTWTFNLENKTITIVNSVDISNTFNVPIFTGNDSGTFTFNIKEEGNSQYLIVENRKGKISYSESSVTIDYGIAFDDIAYKLTR